jgi:hypothetical protein
LPQTTNEVRVCPDASRGNALDRDTFLNQVPVVRPGKFPKFDFGPVAKGKVMGKRERKKNTSRVGAVAELGCALDAVTKGFFVFRNVSPEGPVDLLFLKNNTVLRVQVKKGERVKEGIKALANSDALGLVDSFNRVRYYTLESWVCKHLYPCQMLRRTKKLKSKRRTTR